jgi:CxxC motif-containing protein (DUF1111 family)
VTRAAPLVVASGLAWAAACGDNHEARELLGGENATIFERDALAFTHPIPTLDEDQLRRHNLGRGPFRFNWTPPQLGPLFNHDSCVACHANNGRGLPRIDPGGPGSEALVRVSARTGEPAVPGGPIPVPGFGLQLQDHATFGLPEVHVRLTWVELEDFFGDGERISLREPRLAIVQPNGEPFPSEVDISFRQAPALVGIGLLEAIPEAALEALADPDDADGNGISGRINRVWDDRQQATRLGRFGRKANVATAELQIAGAFEADIGLTNELFPEPDGVTRDLNDELFANSVFHVVTLAVPAAAPRDDRARRGRQLFHDFGCADCHVPTHVTGPHEIPQLAYQTIHPYTDLLLHDMGEGLADDRADFLASGSEWRTPPLWGIGLAQIIQPEVGFLHDGRARTLAEAILWHGGEAVSRREAFRNASRDDREALLAFLETL